MNLIMKIRTLVSYKKACNYDIGDFFGKKEWSNQICYPWEVELLKLFLFVVQTIINHAEYCDNNYHNTCFS